MDTKCLRGFFVDACGLGIRDDGIIHMKVLFHWGI